MESLPRSHPLPVSASGHPLPAGFLVSSKAPLPLYLRAGLPCDGYDGLLPALLLAFLGFIAFSTTDTALFPNASSGSQGLCSCAEGIFTKDWFLFRSLTCPVLRGKPSMTGQDLHCGKGFLAGKGQQFLVRTGHSQHWSIYA